MSQNCVVIFSKSTCPYCKMAKNVFNEIGATYKVIELDEHNDGRRMQEALAQMTGARTVRASSYVLGSQFQFHSLLFLTIVLFGLHPRFHVFILTQIFNIETKISCIFVIL